jgi:hypothetical protein
MATAVKTRSELGASNLSKGKAWMYDFAKWMRAAGGFPSFEVIAQNGRADGAGLLDWTVELKNIVDEYKIPAAVDQARRDQAARGTRWHVVIKKRYRKGPGDGLAIMTVAQWAEIAQILDRIIDLEKI